MAARCLQRAVLRCAARLLRMDLRCRSRGTEAGSSNKRLRLYLGLRAIGGALRYFSMKPRNVLK